MSYFFNMKKLGGAAAGALLLMGLVATPAQAQTTASLQAQIQALLAQIAALQAQAGGGATASITFSRDLTLGSSGADVTALQNFLINKGFTIPAGATGYFGAQTAAALGKYQAANGIAPAAGYFGPVTRAKVNATTGTGSGTGTGTGSGSTTGALKGGEADLSDFKLSREQTSGSEGETEVDVATAAFDVEDGDVRVERLELVASSTNAALNQQPWRYIDHVTIFANGKQVAEKDVDTRRDWDESRGQYHLTFTGLNYVVREGDRAELTVAFDIRNNIDSADLTQQFALSIPDNGIRAVDSEGIQHYIGDEDKAVVFGFDEEESGDLRIKTSSEDPDATTLIADSNRESDEYTVFAFDLENKDDVDVEVRDLSIGVTSGVDADDVIRRATLVVGREEFSGDISADSITFDDMDLTIDGDDTVTAELVIRLVRNAPDATLRFDITGDTDIDAEGVASGDDADVSGSATSETHTVAMTGVDVASGTNSATVNDGNTLGTFRLSFKVKALEDDVYIYAGAAAGDNDTTPFSGVASTTGVVYTIYQGGSASTTVVGDSALLQSDADRSGNYYVVREGQTEDFTLTVSLDPQTASTDLYYMELDAIRFDNETASGTADDSVYFFPNTRAFETNAVSITGS